MICTNCCDADLAAAATGIIWPHRPIDGMLGTRRVRRKSKCYVFWEWRRTDSCEFCAFLHRLLRRPETPFDERLSRPISVSGISGSTQFSIPQRGNQSEPFGVVNTSTISDSTNTISVLTKVPPLVNCYDRIRDYISNCALWFPDKSERGCNLGDDLPLITRINIMDCRSRNIIPAPDGCSYLTLSYVWGNSSSLYSESRFPQTIEDVISVTLKLGYRYLWVDKLCISQHNETEKQAHIRQMDRIYRNARACLIAVAGDNDDYGLPGVSIVRDIPSARIDGLEVQAFVQYPKARITSSHWAGRGWTFQELLFSRKRIYFTSREVLMDCSCGTIRESTGDIPLSDDRQTLHRMSWPIQPTYAEIYALISQYTRRSLTYSSDILNGFSGVFTAVDGLVNCPWTNFHHIWGVPIFHGMTLTPMEWFLEGLQWNCSHSQHTCRRHPGFPSFSWAGWFGLVTFRHHIPYGFDGEPDLVLPPKSQGAVWIELSSGVKIDFERYCSMIIHEPTAATPSQFIHLRCRCLPIEIIWPHNDNQKEARIFVGPSRESYFQPDKVALRLRPDLESKFGPGLQRRVELYGIILKDVSETKKLDGSPILLIQGMGLHWERVGSLKLSSFRAPLPSFVLYGTHSSGVNRRGPDRVAEWKRWEATISFEMRTFRLG